MNPGLGSPSNSVGNYLKKEKEKEKISGLVTSTSLYRDLWDRLPRFLISRILALLLRGAPFPSLLAKKMSFSQEFRRSMLATAVLLGSHSWFKAGRVKNKAIKLYSIGVALLSWTSILYPVMSPFSFP